MTNVFRRATWAAFLILFSIMAHRAHAQGHEKAGRDKAAEMQAFVNLASEVCRGVVPDIYALETGVLVTSVVKPSLEDDEIEAKEKIVESYRQTLGLEKWCQLYAAEMTEGHLIVNLKRGQ